jgi:dihydropteroate synthase
MGVLNLTPDSFYSGSRIRSEEVLISQAEQMLSAGAAILDLGGLSSRPGAAEISEDEEKKRILPAIEKLVLDFPGIRISVDSYRYNVARAALEAGAVMLNDIGVEGNHGLEELAAEFRVPYVCMHMRGNPQTMQGMTEYEDLVSEVLDFFIRRRQECVRAGVVDIVLDPGFGFAKTISQNFLLLRQLNIFSMLRLPLMVGLSRKATVYKTLNISPDQALNGTTVLHTLALEQGADILRAHDVKEAVEAVKLWTAYRKS